MDGEIIVDNLRANHLTEKWLYEELNNRGLSVKLFYAVRSTNGDLIFDQYKDNIQQPIDVE